MRGKRDSQDPAQAPPLIAQDTGPSPLAGQRAGRQALDIPDHTLLRRIGQGSYGEVWLARNAIGIYRAVKVVFQDEFADPRPYEREFSGMCRFEPLSRSNEGFVDILQVGRNDEAHYSIM
jgi:hypothetical protein